MSTRRRLCAADVDKEEEDLDADVRAELEESDDDEGNLQFEVQNGKVVAVNPVKPNTQGQKTTMKAQQPNRGSVMESSVLRRIHVEGFTDDVGSGGGKGSAAMNKQVIADLQEAVDRGAHSAANVKKVQGHDRSERATVESVLDPRTRLILYKLVNSGLLSEINGCVSTGKEAHVYFAKRGDGLGDAAVKVYNTSVLVFKDREKYVTGEFRFQRYCKSNPRKMVRTWAEKEARNLARLQNGGIRVPQVILLRQHVLVMEFLGVDGWPSPKLKEVKFDDPELLWDCYVDLLAIMRRMYRTCRLVHGDLSEYNLLFHDHKVVVIDVSQSVEHDHPESISFLRRDVVNVTRFFRGRGLAQHLLSLPQLFFLATAEPEDLYKKDPNDPALGDPNLVPKLNRLSRSTSVEEDIKDVVAFVKRCEEVRPIGTDSEEVYSQEEARFLEVQHKKLLKEEDALLPKKGNTDDAAPTAANGGKSLKDDESGSESGSEEDEEGEGEEGDEEDGEGKPSAKKNGGPTLAEMTKEQRREHQRLVKEEKRQKRAEKIPKHQKKKACTQHKRK